MSDTQAKATPSKAARELTEKLFDQMPVMFRIQRKERVASMIQSALSELLEKAQTFKTCEYGGKGCAAYDKPLCRTCAIQKALEPWKPGE